MYIYLLLFTIQKLYFLIPKAIFFNFSTQFYCWKKAFKALVQLNTLCVNQQLNYQILDQLHDNVPTPWHDSCWCGGSWNYYKNGFKVHVLIVLYLVIDFFLQQMPVIIAGNKAQKDKYLTRMIEEPLMCVSNEKNLRFMLG